MIRAGRPWIDVKSKFKKEYPSVQYVAWTVLFIIPFSILLLLNFCGADLEENGKTYCYLSVL